MKVYLVREYGEEQQEVVLVSASKDGAIRYMETLPPPPKGWDYEVEEWETDFDLDGTCVARRSGGSVFDYRN